MTILNVGYGTTDPQKLLHLVQSNVTLILQDSRNNNEGTTNIEFIQGSGNFGENAFVDWQLSNSNSTFCIKRAFDNITSDVVIFSHDGNVNVSNDLSVNGTFIRNGTDIYTYFEDRIDSVISGLFDGNYFSLTNQPPSFDFNYNSLTDIPFTTIDENTLEVVGGVLKVIESNTSNYVSLTSNLLSNNLNTAIDDTSNYVLQTSNYVQHIEAVITTRIDGVDNVDNIFGFFKNTQFEKDNSDYINIKKASANNIGGIKVGDNTTIDNFGVLSVDMASYIGDVELKGDLVTSNLTILGDSTTLKNNVFITESLEINNTGTGAAISVTQTGSTDDIFIASNIGGEVFSIINNGNVGIGITEPENILDVDGDINITGNYKVNGNNLSYSDLVGTPDQYTLPVATTSVLGGIKVGSNLSIDGTGIVSAILVKSDWDAISGDAEILNKPTLFDGNYNSLTNKPTLFSGSYHDLTNKLIFDTNDFNIQYDISSGTSISINSSGQTNQVWTTTGNNIYYNSGNVGIGTNNPTEKLEVNGNIKYSGVCFNDYESITLNQAGWVKIGRYKNSTNCKFVVDIKGIGNHDILEIDVFHKYKNTTGESIQIKSGFSFSSSSASIKNIKITNYKSSDIYAERTIWVQYETNNTNNTILRCYLTLLHINNEFNTIGGLAFQTTQPSGTLFQTNDNGITYINHNMSILDGNVGIGTTNPRHKIDIYNGNLGIRSINESTDSIIYLGCPYSSSSAYKGAIIFDANGTWSTGTLHICNRDVLNDNTTNASIADARISILRNGNVGIGTTNPTYKLDVSGNIRCTSLYQTSDKRLKNNIQNLNSVLDLINGVNPVSFNIETDNKTKYGFIAQELENIIPDIVNTPNDDDDYYCVDYVSMIPLLTKSTQELHKIIIEQENKISKLEEILARNGIV